MTKDQAYCHYVARQIWRTQFPDEHIQGDEARISFEALVARGLFEGICAWEESLVASQSGNIDTLFVGFSHRFV